MKQYRFSRARRYIYGLTDPRTGQCHYVGQSCEPGFRLTSHLSESENAAKGRWIKDLRNRGLRPIIVVLEDMPEEGKSAALEREYWWIAEMKRRGEPITNMLYKGCKCTRGDLQE